MTLVLENEEELNRQMDEDSKRLLLMQEEYIRSFFKKGCHFFEDYIQIGDLQIRTKK